jgi:simple sugar transport system ATP-binding protein
LISREKLKSIVELENVSKSYGPIVSLKPTQLQIGNNEIVGLIGDNGAGKSTLIKLITGLEFPTSGKIFVKGQQIDLNNYSVKVSQNLGIETVYQKLSLCEKQPLWRNFFAGRPITNSFGFIDVKKQKKITAEIMKNTIGFRSDGINVDTPVGYFSGGERQGIAIGRAMYFESDLIILDEPTVALAISEVEKVLKFVKNIKLKGKSCIFIEHNIHHVHQISDRIIVLDRGEVVLNCPKESIEIDDLIEFLKKLHLKKDKN